jgi:hypothetical protein
MYRTAEAQMEYEDAMFNESLSQGAYMRAAVNEYARNHGEMNRDRAWILSPFDTWEANPYYRGPAMPHPEDAMAMDADDPALLGIFRTFKEASKAAAAAARVERCPVKVIRKDGGWAIDL